MKQNLLIAYALSCTSFLIEQMPLLAVERIILFGSVARGNFDEESDVDLFIDTHQDIEKEANRVLTLFQKSEIQRKWELKGVSQTISLKIGRLSEWELRRDILTDGIILYGKYKEMPEKIEYYLLIEPSFIKFDKVKKVQLWRKLHGYSQKVNEKAYRTKGLLEIAGGKKVEHGMLIPMNQKKIILDLLQQEKVPYKVFEVWSDVV